MRMSNRSPASRDPIDTRTALIVAAISVAAYSFSFRTGFNADDFFILARVKAQVLAHPIEYFRMGFFEFYRPLVFLSHALDWRVWGLNAFGFHLTNVLLHAVNTVLVFLLGRRLLTRPGATAAALLFALHPGSHEAVHWIAARFDLMATCFTLVALLLVTQARSIVRAGGFLAFGLALLSKESAVSLLVIAPAWDVWIEGRNWRMTARRLLPLIAVAVAYAGLRMMATELEPAGGGRRIAKLAMLAAAIASVLIAAYLRDRPLAPARNHSQAGDKRMPWVVFLAVALVVLASFLWWPMTSAWTAQKLGFVAYAVFYLLSPVVMPGPAPEWFSPDTARDAIPGLIAAGLIAFLVLRCARVLRGPQSVFLFFFIGAALMPVSSMVGGLRYLYLASAGVALFCGWAVQQIPASRQRLTAAALVAVLLVSASQIFVASRAWRANAELTRAGVELMAAGARPCDQTDVLLLTAPVGQGDVYGNFYWEAFDILAGCSPRTFTPVLRVVRTDAEVEALRTANSIDLHVLNYAGNIVASADLRNFGAQVSPGTTAAFKTPIGEIQTYPQGTTQVFRIPVTAQTAGARLFYYSAGAIHTLERTP
jgi:Dolichyl-phosphate-mannose-protein mannosyltransferase